MREKSHIIRDFIVENIKYHQADIARLTATHFQISRAAVARHIKALVDQHVLMATGNTKARTYALVPLIDERFSLSTAGLQEDLVWRERIAPFLADMVPQNVLTICNYGFTEMLNNAIDHSESDTVHITMTVDAAAVHLWVRDFGIGVFQKLMRDLHLHDARHALLELSKGKLTTAAAKHSGQGIFFTSRMFDEYVLWANGFAFCHFNKNDDWLFESRKDQQGTLIMMMIYRRATQTADEIMSRYASELNNFGFTKTHVPIQLAKYEGEQLVSRSQAKRLLLRVEQFKEVLLDFKGITMIGQAFADEIFRVFQRDHPNLLIVPINANEEVNKMISRASKETIEELTPSLFDNIQENDIEEDPIT